MKNLDVKISNSKSTITNGGNSSSSQGIRVFSSTMDKSQTSDRSKTNQTGNSVNNSIHNNNYGKADQIYQNQGNIRNSQSFNNVTFNDRLRNNARINEAEQKPKKKGIFDFLKKKKKIDSSASSSNLAKNQEKGLKSINISTNPSEMSVQNNLNQTEKLKTSDTTTNPSYKKVKKQPGKVRKVIGGIFKFIFFTFLALLLIFAGLGLYAYNKYGKPLLLAKDAAEIAMDEAKGLKSDFKNRDTSKVESRIDNISAQIDVLETNLKVIEDFKNVSQIQGYYGNYEIGMSMLPKVQELLEVSKPHIKTIMDTLIAEAVTSTAATTETTDTDSSPDTTTTETTQDPTATTETVNVCAAGDATYELSGGANSLVSEITDVTIGEEEETATSTEESGDNPMTIKGLVKSMPEISLLYQDIEPILLDLAGDFNKIDANYFPKTIFGDLSANIVKAQTISTEFIAEYETVSTQIKETLEMLPYLLGSEKPVTFLVVPQNEKEMRSSGGLLTAYGIMTVYQGEIIGDITTVDMWELENYLTWDLGITPGYVNIYGQLTLMENGCGAYSLRAQDSGIYADNYVSMDMFKDYYDIAHTYDPGKYPAYDHIVTFNTFFISDLIRLVEPIYMDDGDYLCAYDAAKKIYYETSINPEDFDSRKSYIGKVGDVLQERITHMSVDEILTVGQILMGNVMAKHISFYSKDASMQAYFDEMGMTARTVNDFDGDYFQLSEAQNCALKANFYVYDVVTQNINISDSGDISKTITVQWTNEKVYDPAEEQMLTGTIYFLYRAWLRFYSPAGSSYWDKSTTGMISTYFNYPSQYYDDIMQKETWDDIMWYDHRRMTSDYPIKTASYTVNQASPDIADYNAVEGYKLLIQKHPGKKSELYNIIINYQGQQYSTQLKLDRDKVVVFKDGTLSVEDYPSKMDALYSFIGTMKTMEF